MSVPAGCCYALGVNKENLLRVVGKTNFRILKRDSDVVFDAEHEFHIRFSFWRTEISKIAFHENRNLANLKNSFVFHGLRTWTKFKKFQKNENYFLEQHFLSQKKWFDQNFDRKHENNFVFAYFFVFVFPTLTPNASQSESESPASVESNESGDAEEVQKQFYNKHILFRNVFLRFCNYILNICF